MSATPPTYITRRTSPNAADTWLIFEVQDGKEEPIAVALYEAGARTIVQALNEQRKRIVLIRLADFGQATKWAHLN